MSTFKIIAVKPLENCESYIRKNLIENELYSLYRNYKEENGKIINTKYY